MPVSSNREIGLTCFGVGEGWPCHDRRHSSYLYRFGESHILVDCGEGLSTAYKVSGLSYDLVDRVLISHLHSDHVGSFSLWMQGLWLEGRQRPVTVSAPLAAIADKAPPLGVRRQDAPSTDLFSYAKARLRRDARPHQRWPAVS